MWPVATWMAGRYRSSPVVAPAGRYQFLDGRTLVLDRPASVITAPQWESSTGALPNPFAVSETAWPLQPRPFSVQSEATTLASPANDVYRQDAVRLAGDLGGKGEPTLLSVGRGDLDGDGTDEVVVSAEARNTDHIDQVGFAYEKPGSYSMVFVRHVAGNSAAVTLVTSTVVKGFSRMLPSYLVDGAADLDGDGRSEVLGSAFMFESAAYYGWDVGSPTRAPVVLFDAPGTGFARQLENGSIAASVTPPVELRARVFLRTERPATRSVGPYRSNTGRVAIFSRDQTLGSPSLLVYTTADSCGSGDSAATAMKVNELDTHVWANRCLGPVSVAVEGDRIPRATVEAVAAGVQVDASGVVTSYGPVVGDLTLVATNEQRVPLEWSIAYGSPTTTARVSFAKTTESVAQIRLRELLVGDPRGQSVETVHSLPAVYIVGDTGMSTIVWFENSYLVSLSVTSLSKADLITLAQDIHITAGDLLFELA